MSRAIWQRGYSLQQLRPIAALFTEHDRGMVRSRFSRFSEAQVADALSRGFLRGIAERGTNELRAAFVLRTRPSERQWFDFRGYPVAFIPAGCWIIERMACAPGYEGALLAGLHRLPRPLFCEAWQEHPVERGLMDGARLSWLGTKVSAASELRGLYGSHRAAAAPLGLDRFGLVRLELPWDRAQVAAELAHAEPAWTEHYSSYNRRRSWYAFALRGYSDDPAFIEKPTEMSRSWKEANRGMLDAELRDTALLGAFPAVSRLIGALPCGVQRVRFMLLAGGIGELARHADITDPDAGSRDGQLMRLHLPVQTSQAVRFTSWLPDGSAQSASMAEGETWWLDTRKPHQAINQGAADRIHLVIDAEATPELRDLCRFPAEVTSPWHTPRIEPRQEGWRSWAGA